MTISEIYDKINQAKTVPIIAEGTAVILPEFAISLSACPSLECAKLLLNATIQTMVRDPRIASGIGQSAR